MNKLKYLSFLFAALVSVGCMFTSCDDDDNFPIENQIAGEYKGTLDVSMAGQSMATDMPQNITVDKAASNAINLTLANFNIAGMSVGDVTLTGLVLNEQNSGTYSFSGTQSLTLADPVGTVPVEYFGVITNGKITIDLGITWNDMDIAVAYQGDKLNGTESGEAAITAFSFKADEDDDLSFITSQPVINADNSITFSVADTTTTEHLQTLQPVVEVSAGATYTASGSDYMTGVTYTVVSENGRNIATYTVRIASRINSLKYTFKEWTELASEMNSSYPKWYSPEPVNQLATANEGVSMLMAIDLPTLGFPGYKGDFATVKEDNGYQGAAVKLSTVYTEGTGLPVAPAVTAGSLFTGSFVLNAVEQLKSTRFGISYDKKPISFKGAYKYTPGTNYVDGSKDPIEENLPIVDKGAIQAILYEATDAENNEVTLTGENINDQSYWVAAVSFTVDETTDWTTFEKEFTWYKDYDASKTYKMAIICSSSVDGADYIGAVGSTLWVDELEVTGEVVASGTAE